MVVSVAVAVDADDEHTGGVQLEGVKKGKETEIDKPELSDRHGLLGLPKFRKTPTTHAVERAGPPNRYAHVLKKTSIEDKPLNIHCAKHNTSECAIHETTEAHEDHVDHGPQGN
ncbi:hypothetical protein NDU88_005230 [Pleurodeles waltl]|uniref:Uncharacterized protein n=1 Tax=Pleurodeles waltl TaxID=8319 RepID=A0AAV7NND8_PLEWA|nr:hypothetical protein NDU88_005230 [Pleurodeles waltl]